MLPTKIVVVGAGSASFGLKTLGAILRSEALRGSTLGLVDTHPGRLHTIAALARRINREWDAGFVIESGTDRTALLADARFVIFSLEVGPREDLWRLDWEITLRHGVRQPYGENGGPGGFAHAARNIAAIMPILRDMERLCPDAWLVNFTNPVPRICLAATRYTTIRTVGLCHQIKVAYAIAGQMLADELGVVVPNNVDSHPDPARPSGLGVFSQQVRELIDVKVAGLNHLIWLLDVRERASGRDLTPLFHELLWQRELPFEPLSQELFKVFGLCPVPGDSHLCEYLPWCHDADTRPWEKYNLRLYDWEAAKAARHQMWMRVEAMVCGRLGGDELKHVASEGAVELIEGIAGNGNSYLPTVNLPNNAYIPNLPAGVIVEVPGLATGSGVYGLPVGQLPEPIAELCRRETVVASLSVDAAVTGSRRLALQSLLLDPTVNDMDRARHILDDILTVHAEWLPQFQGTDSSADATPTSDCR
jgi:alpha-galactosidase